ncbi:MAG TPA: TatD family hydrolase [Chitinophagaceae bacterium]|nr:TatD family hydrolase [Chitinophagaceae bacterium]HNU14112.1 TatD family hydrolase [Chitinophagaceae bacterium]
MIIDTHSHIYLPEFEKDVSEVFERAEKQGVNKILMPAIDSSTHLSMIELEKQNPERFFCMMGLHPCSVKENFREELKIARDYLDKRNFVAIGEIGLDFYWDRTFTEQQHEAFHTQVEWAIHFDIPIVIHSRNSTDECIKVVTQHQKGKLKGVFHCFSGNAEQARQVIDLGFYLGIGGVVTFKNAGLDKVIESVGLEDVLLETDAPYLAPVPFRGKRNEPSYLKYVVNKLADIKNCSVQEVAVVTTKNAEKLFRLKN